MGRKLERVVLVTPPYHSGVVESAGTWMPLGLTYLAGAVRESGREPVIYDAMSKFHTHAQIEATLRELKPDVVATTAITATFPDAVEVLRTAKRIDPSVTTMIGNVHPTFLWEETLTEHGDAVDFIVQGEGEVTLPELLDALDDGADLAGVRGLAYLVNGRPTVTPLRPFLKDLDALKPAWDLVEWDIYSYRPEPGSTLAVISTSRGCNQACTFCSQQLFWKRSWRMRSPESVVAELEHLRDAYGVNVAMLADETPTIDRERWVRLLDLLIERKVGTKLLMETRVDDILRDEDLLGRYLEAGIVHIYVGVESPNQDELDVFKKNIKAEDSRRAIELINKAGIVSETSFVLGMPHETRESIRKTIDLAIHYNPDMAFFLAIAPWPYAEIYEELKPYIEVTDYRRYNLVEPVVKPTNMTLEELHAEMDRAHQVFFMDKMIRLPEMSPEKRKFMVAVMDLLVKHSYLGEKMKGMAGHAKMPEEIKAIFREAGLSPPVCPYKPGQPGPTRDAARAEPAETGA